MYASWTTVDVSGIDVHARFRPWLLLGEYVGGFDNRRKKKRKVGGEEWSADVEPCPRKNIEWCMRDVVRGRKKENVKWRKGGCSLSKKKIERKVKKNTHAQLCTTSPVQGKRRTRKVLCWSRPQSVDFWAYVFENCGRSAWVYLRDDGREGGRREEERGRRNVKICVRDRRTRRKNEKDKEKG